VSARHESAVALLRERCADDVAHPGGTLLAHLVRVHDRLLRLCGDEILALAGLTHAVYGTDGFGTSLLSLDERHVLAQAVGTEVEELVYLYGALLPGRLVVRSATVGRRRPRPLDRRCPAPAALGTWPGSST